MIPRRALGNITNHTHFLEEVGFWEEHNVISVRVPIIWAEIVDFDRHTVQLAIWS